MKQEHVLIFGGNGRIARSMTALMLARSWKVTSTIRNIHQKDNLIQIGKSQPGSINVLNLDLRNLETSDDAKKIIETVKPTIVVFAAGKPYI
jgi:nucleoside-diphosphate-sugar epimerase